MSEPIYRVVFVSQAEIFEIYVKKIYQSDMYGFVEVEGYIFGERSKLVVDPAEEKLKSLFTGVKRSYIPMHTIIRIDEVEKEGIGKITEFKGEKVTPFPLMPQGKGRTPE